MFQDKLLDLTETASSTSLPRCRDGLIRVTRGRQAVSYNGIKVGVLGKLIQSRHSSKAVAVLTELENSTLMAIRFRDGNQIAFKTTTTPTYRLQVRDDITMLRGGNLSVQVITPDGNHHHNPCSPRLHPPARMALYNGVLFNIDIEDQYKIRVSPSVTSSDAKLANRVFRVYQDEEHPQFCLAYKPTGIVLALVDLKAQTADIVSERQVIWEFQHVAKNMNANDPDNYLRMVGISNGSVQVWKFSRDFLAAKYRQQHDRDLPEQFKAALKEVPSGPRLERGVTSTDAFFADEDFRKIFEIGLEFLKR